MPLALLALTISAFAIGTTEFGIVGLIPTISSDLGITLPSAGLMVLFTIGNLVAWRAPGYESLIVARILTGLAHGVFFPVGSIIATTLVPKDKAPSAMTTMFSGMTVASVAGIPLGTFIAILKIWEMGRPCTVGMT